MRIPLIGPEEAGKTCILENIKRKKVPKYKGVPMRAITATIGVNLAEVPYRETLQMTLWDVGGMVRQAGSARVVASTAVKAHSVEGGPKHTLGAAPFLCTHRQCWQTISLQCGLPCLSAHSLRCWLALITASLSLSLSLFRCATCGTSTMGRLMALPLSSMAAGLMPNIGRMRATPLVREKWDGMDCNTGECSNGIHGRSGSL